MVANRTAPLAKQKAKRDREQDEAAAPAATEATSTAKRRHNMPFDDSQQSMQDEPRDSQPQESPVSESATLQHEGQGEQTEKKKRKNTTKLMSEISIEVEKA